MKRIGFYIFYSFIWLITWLPLRVLYIFSDLFYPLLYYVIGYRRGVVRMNLQNSFPDSSPQEILKIEKRHYHHLCDYFIETMKLLHISESQMRRRMQFDNTQVIQDMVDQGDSVLLLMGHYGNFEWITSVNLHVHSIDLPGEVYRKLNNPYFDRFFFQLRHTFGTEPIEKSDVLKRIIATIRAKKIFVLGFIADQTPSIHNIHCWLSFLNQDTPILGGPERIAQKVGAGVVYLDVIRLSRGYYKVVAKKLFDPGQPTAPNEISECYMSSMEQTIMRDPAYWFWSHKRWKHTR